LVVVIVIVAFIGLYGVDHPTDDWYREVPAFQSLVIRGDTPL
jgi:hypothetical protein